MVLLRINSTIDLLIFIKKKKISIVLVWLAWVNFYVYFFVNKDLLGSSFVSINRVALSKYKFGPISLVFMPFSVYSFSVILRDVFLFSFPLPAVVHIEMAISLIQTLDHAHYLILVDLVGEFIAHISRMLLFNVTFDKSIKRIIKINIS